MTTTALKAIDSYGGIDNYILRLDDKTVEQSNYVSKVRRMITTSLFHKGELEPQMIRRLGYDKVPPAIMDLGNSTVGDREDDSPHLI
jgi:hypothetical protein